jgi:flagellar biogenesis protein FliO
LYTPIFDPTLKDGMPAPKPTNWTQTILLLLAILFFITALILILKK